jgi:hypothetical protein
LANRACSSILVIFVLAIVVLVIRAWPVPWSEGGEAGTRFHHLSNTSMETFIAHQYGLADLQVVGRSFRRNSTGDKLYFQIFHPDARTYSHVVLSPESEPVIEPTPTKYTFLNDRQEIVASLSEDRAEVEFADGTRQKLARLSTIDSPYVPHYGAFNVDPSGSYFVMQASAHGTDVGRVDQPRSPIGTINLALSHVFADGNELYLVGTPIGARFGGAFAVPVLVRAVAHEDHLEELERFSVPGLWVRDVGKIIVYDLDMKTETLAFYGGRDFLTSHNYLFSILSKTLRRSRSTPGDGLFLNDELRTMLKELKPRAGGAVSGDVDDRG